MKIPVIHIPIHYPFSCWWFTFQLINWIEAKTLNSSQLCRPQTELVMKLLVRLKAIRNTLQNLKALFVNTTLWGDVDVGVPPHFMIYQRQEMKETSIFDEWMFVLVTNLDWCKQTLLKAMRWKQKGNHLVFYLMWV